MWVSGKWAVAPPSTVELRYRRISGTFWLQHSFYKRVSEKLYLRRIKQRAESFKRGHSTSSSSLYIFTLTPCVYIHTHTHITDTQTHTEILTFDILCEEMGNIHRTLHPPRATEGCHSLGKALVWLSQLEKEPCTFFPMGHYFYLKNDWKTDVYTDSESYI